MKLYIITLVVLCSLSLAAPVMAAANLTATQTSYTEMQVDGTGFTGSKVTLSTKTSIPVTPSGGDYSYEITGIYLPADSVLKLDASPVNDDLKLYVKRYWPLAWTFYNVTIYRDAIHYQYTPPTENVHVHRSVPSGIAGTFQTLRVYGTTVNPSIDLNVTVEQPGVAVSGGNFSKTIDINAVPAGDYMIRATDGTNIATTNVTIYAPGQLHHIEITNPENITYPQTGELPLNTTGNYTNYTFGATGYDFGGKVVQTTFVWWSSSTYVGTIDLTGYFEADKVGHTEVYARSGTKESNHVIVYVNAPTDTGNVTDGSGNATSGNSTVDVTLNATVNGTVNITEIGDPVNGTLSDAGGNDTNLGLGTGAGENQLIKGAVVNANESIHDALDVDAANGTSWVHIKMEYDQSVIDSLGIIESTLDIWKYNETTHVWEMVKSQPYCLESGRDMTANYVWVNVTNLSTIALVGTTKSSPSGGGGGEGTYPPGWFGTPAPAPTATPPPGEAPAPAEGEVTPTPAKPKPAAAGKTPTAPAKETPTKKKGIPGFTAVFVIAGMLAIAYMVMRRRR